MEQKECRNKEKGDEENYTDLLVQVAISYLASWFVIIIIKFNQILWDQKSSNYLCQLLNQMF